MRNAWPRIGAAVGLLGESGDRLARRNRALDMRYAGIAFRHHEERKAAPLMSDPAADLYEAFSFAFLAVGAGIDRLIADIEKLEPPKPDLIVKLTDGSSVYVEVGRSSASDERRKPSSSNVKKTYFLFLSRTRRGLVSVPASFTSIFCSATVFATRGMSKLGRMAPIVRRSRLSSVLSLKHAA